MISRYEAQGEVGLDAIDVTGTCRPGLITECNEALPQVRLPEEVAEGLLSLLQSLVNGFVPPSPTPLSMFGTCSVPQKLALFGVALGYDLGCVGFMTFTI